MAWIRYRFHTRSVDDYRPLVHNPRYPWWCSGEAGDGNHATIVAYLPVGESLEPYWDDAFGIEQEECSEPIYSDRFPRPEWLISDDTGQDAAPGHDAGRAEGA